MTIDFYHAPANSQSHAIQMVAAAVGVALNPIVVDLVVRDHLKPSFVAINPQHTVPTIHDNGFGLWETRAILIYLAEKYAPANSQLYPSGDVERRARINQRLYFDLDTLNRSCRDAYHVTFRTGGPASEESLKKLGSAFDFLNTFLVGEQFVAGGSELSVADFALFTTVSVCVHFGQYDTSKHAKVDAWFKRLQNSIPGVEFSIEGLKHLTAYAEKNWAEHNSSKK